MAVTWKATTNVNRGNTATPVLDKPASMADTNTLVVIIQHDTAGTVVTQPTGFVHRGSQASSGSDSAIHVWTRYIADAAAANAEGTWTFEIDAANGGTTVSCIVAEGGNASTVLDVAIVTEAPASTATPDAGPITPVTNGCLIIGANSTDPTSGTYTGTPTASPAFTERLEFGVSATSNIYIETYEQATAASVTSQPTMSTADTYATAILALRPVTDQTIAAGLTSETDTAQAMTVGKALALGQPSETDTAQAATVLKTVALGLITETETAQPITVLKTVPVGQVSETDSALGVTRAVFIPIGLVSETDTAQAITVGKTVTLGQPSEADTAQTVTSAKTVPAGQVSETDTPQALTVAKTVAIGQASETDTAQPVTIPGPIVVPIGQVSETDAVFSVAALKTLTLGQAIENAEAFAITQFKKLALGQPSETDTAFTMIIVGGTQPEHPGLVRGSMGVAGVSTR